jgi:OmpA-OmpF porin, OOP family
MSTKRSWPVIALTLALVSLGLCGMPLFASSQDDSVTALQSKQEVAAAQGILQHMDLLAHGSYRQGEMDAATIAALKHFQRDHTLLPTGRIDRETMTQLLQHQPGKDSDGDGVMDGLDKCPNTPAGAKVDRRGCPLDADGDGVADGLDKCPDTPKGVKVNADGCIGDTDGDGVADDKDRCPDTPRGARVDANGCVGDADGDGVTDDRDRCPDTPRGTRVDANGCVGDADGDGVADDRDRCPDSPRGAKVDAQGCPEPSALPAAGGAHLVLEGVNFQTSSAKLTPESLAVLDRVVEGLKGSPDVRILIEGHTDSQGPDDANRKLSKGRADAVRDYFLSKGIAKSRLETKGYGETKPIGDNKTAEGRAKNRRVELSRL